MKALRFAHTTPIRDTGFQPVPTVLHRQHGLKTRVTKHIAYLISFGVATMVCGCITYRAQPLKPVESQAAFQSRTLSNPRIMAIGKPPASTQPSTAPTQASGNVTWDLDALTRAAMELHPDIASARAHFLATLAGEKTAAEMPNPSFQWSPQYVTNRAGTNPWVLASMFDWPIETAGKREDRIEQARAQTQMAMMDMADAVWKVRGRLRDALAEYLLDRQEIELWNSEVQARTEYVRMLQERFTAGEAGRGEVDIARVDLLTATQSRSAARGKLADARAKLAAAIGLPESGLQECEFSWPELERFVALDAAVARLQRAGLFNRIDIRRALAEYDAAEAALKLEIAKQYPDLHLNPGYEFDQAENKWGFGFTITLPILNQNRGAIGEAEAHRAELATKFLGLQAQVIGQMESALAVFNSARAELSEADSQLSISRRQQDAAEHLLQAGEQDRLTFIGAQVQTLVAQRLRLDAIRKAQAGRAAIEDAIERPVEERQP